MKLRVTVQGKVFEVDVEVLESEGAVAPAIQTGSAIPPTPGASTVQPAASVPAASAGAKVFPAPLAGTVRSVLVKPGQQVNTNDEMLILEAMKMETAVSAAHGGKIRAVLVNVGDAVQAGQGLIEFE